MSYASRADLVAFTQDMLNLTVPTDEDAVARLIERAERDVDRALGPYPLLEDGRKLDPTDLTEIQAAALSRATCAQAVHRLLLGEDFFSEPEDLLTGDVRILRAAEHVSGRVREELAGTGLITRSGTLTPPAA